MEISNTLRWFGIDVSKATFDIALFPSDGRKAHHKQFPRTQHGCQECLHWVEEHVPPGQFPSLVMESTGGYSKQMAHWFLASKQDLRVAIAQPFRVHYFAKGLGFQNKTDAQDAIMLARFGEVHKPTPYQPMSAAYEELRALTRERAALVKAAISLGNRNEIPSESRQTQKVRERMMAYHQKAIADLEQAMNALIRKDPVLAKDAKRLQTVPGVGPVVVATLMGELGDLRDYPHPKALTAFVGVVPALGDSGTSVHEPAHMTKHGSSRVRHMLYLAAMASIRGENTLARSYDHLVQEGKEPMVALGAVMRKILVLCRALLVSETDYNPKFIKQAPTCNQ
jgi:transposase